MVALLKSGRAVVPGDTIIATTEALRMWGTRIHTDGGATVDVEARITSITFERDPDTAALTWSGEAAANVPVRGREEPVFKIIHISADTIREEEVAE